MSQNVRVQNPLLKTHISNRETHPLALLDVIEFIEIIYYLLLRDNTWLLAGSKSDCGSLWKSEIIEYRWWVSYCIRRKLWREGNGVEAVLSFHPRFQMKCINFILLYLWCSAQRAISIVPLLSLFSFTLHHSIYYWIHLWFFSSETVCQRGIGISIWNTFFFFNFIT